MRGLGHPAVEGRARETGTADRLLRVNHNVLPDKGLQQPWLALRHLNHRAVA